MHIATLKVFCDLAETGSFSLAASKNFITQSAVSQKVRSLEEHYGWELIERSKGHVRLTQAGEVLYQAGKEIVQKYREIEDSLQTLSRPMTGTVQVATVDSVGLYELSSPLKRYLRTFPDINVHLEYTRGNRIYEDVSRGDIDLGIVAYPSKRPQILVTPFREDRLVLVCAPQHPFAQFHRISIKKLQGEKFVGFERDIPTRRALDKILRRHGVKVQYVMEVDNIETIKRVVEIGSGISIVPEPCIAQEIQNETFKTIQFTDEVVMRPLGIISKRGRRFSPAVQEFVEFLTEKPSRGTAGESDRALQAMA
jgi:LysR family transcriptional regulator, transcriptional activator of the cysJI operon